MKVRDDESQRQLFVPELELKQSYESCFSLFSVRKCSLFPTSSLVVAMISDLDHDWTTFQTVQIDVMISVKDEDERTAPDKTAFYCDCRTECEQTEKSSNETQNNPITSVRAAPLSCQQINKNRKRKNCNKLAP